VAPKLVRAQERAHCGIFSSWAETRVAAKPVAIAMIADPFILILILRLGWVGFLRKCCYLGVVYKC